MAKSRDSWYFETKNTFKAERILWHLNDEGIEFKLGFRLGTHGRKIWEFYLKPSNVQVARTLEIVEQFA